MSRCCERNLPGEGSPSAQRQSERPFGPAHRLRTKKQLDAVRSHGRSRAGSRCVVVAALPEDGQRRLGIIISRRYSPKAVVRNRARRLYREAYRLLYPGLKPMWVVLIPRWRMKTAKLDNVLGELRDHFDALGLQTTTGESPEGGEAHWA